MRLFFLLCLGLIISGMQSWAVDLIVSNYPEKITAPGRIFEKQISTSPLQILYHHQNQSETSLFIKLEVENQLETPSQFRVVEGVAGPVKDELFAGHQSTKRFMTSMMNKNFQTEQLKPGEVKTIVMQKVKPALVVSGLLQIESLNREKLLVRMTVVDPKYPHLSTYSQNYRSSYFKDAIKHIKLDYDCDGLVYDIPIGGPPYRLDGQSGLKNRGSYGEWHQLNVTLKNSDPRQKTVSLYVSPRGGVTRAVMLIDHEMVETKQTHKALSPEKIYEVQVAGREERSLNILLMPQSGSNYPINLVLQSEG